jgi:hypothetical protein
MTKLIVAFRNFAKAPKTPFHSGRFASEMLKFIDSSHVIIICFPSHIQSPVNHTSIAINKHKEWFMTWTDKPQASTQVYLITTSAECMLGAEEQESVMMFQKTSIHFVMAVREIKQRRYTRQLEQSDDFVLYRIFSQSL